MRSLSLESIPVNKNMKLLILLVALFVRTNPSLSKPISYHHLPTTFVIDIKVDLHGMQKEMDKKQHELKQLLTAFNHTVKIRTPHDLKNACECEASFVQHLNDAVVLLEQVFPNMDAISNILDCLNDPRLPTVKKPNANCTFRPHKLSEASLNDFIQDNIAFIENWNSNCKPKKQHN